jgi:hypothetical protein
MPWNPTWPDGTKSVSQNTPTGLQNTTYTETEMNKDHYWNFGIDENGHHRFVQTVGTNDADPSLPTNTPLANLLDLAYFSRYKTPTENPVNQDCQPFVKNLGPAGEADPWPAGVMQLLGIRAYGVFKAVGGVITMYNSFNLRSPIPIVEVGGANPTYQAFFSRPLPNNSYAVLGGGVFHAGASTVIDFYVSGAGGGGLTDSMTVDWVKFRFYTSGGAPGLVAPLQGWFVVFGG